MDIGRRASQREGKEKEMPRRPQRHRASGVICGARKVGVDVHTGASLRHDITGGGWMAAPVMLVQGRGWVMRFLEITCTLLSVIDCHGALWRGRAERRHISLSWVWL